VSGHQVAYAVLRPPQAVCKARLARLHVNDALFEQLWAEFADLGPLESHAIDNGGLTVSATMHELRARLEARALDL
jgi:hypothetical protein